jgi:isopropylmalate/homocitrate/citramalate synthase
MDVIQEHPTVIFPIRPEFVGRKFEMFLGKKSGKPSVKVKLDALGLQASDQQIEEILKLVKARGIEKKGTLTDEEFYGIVREVKRS